MFRFGPKTFNLLTVNVLFWSEYPYPLSNNLSREPVYAEVSNTILAILCDFRNYKYHVVSIPGLSVTIKDTGVTITIPINR